MIYYALRIFFFVLVAFVHHLYPLAVTLPHFCEFSITEVSKFLAVPSILFFIYLIRNPLSEHETSYHEYFSKLERYLFSTRKVGHDYAGIQIGHNSLKTLLLLDDFGLFTVV